MLLNAFIARRYLFSKKSHNAINIITAIAVMGIGVATAAMICVMSVFNGFRDLVSSLYTTFDPELVVVPAKGKFASADDPLLTAVRRNPAVSRASATLTDNALILFSRASPHRHGQRCGQQFSPTWCNCDTSSTVSTNTPMFCNRPA